MHGDECLFPRFKDRLVDWVIFPPSVVNWLYYLGIIDNVLIFLANSNVCSGVNDLPMKDSYCCHSGSAQGASGFS